MRQKTIDNQITVCYNDSVINKGNERFITMAYRQRFTKYQLITMFSLVGMLLFNPLVVEVFDEYFKLAYTVISLLCTAWVLGFLLKKVFTVEAVKIPDGKTTKAQKYKKT